jgi:beta-galactosidase beta subunit
VLVVYDGSMASETALATAAQLVEVHGGYLSIAILAQEREGARALQRQASKWLRERDLQARVRWLVESEREKIKQLVDAEECLLVMPSELRSLSKSAAQEIVQSVRCPVLLVR